MINLGNVVGVVRSINPPLEADNVTEKRYVLWAQNSLAQPTVYRILYYDPLVPGWVGFDTILQQVNSIQTVLQNQLGNLNDLDASLDNTNIVLAINSALGLLTNFIDDVTIATTTGYSSSKIESLVSALNDNIRGSVSAPYNTLKKIEDIIENINGGASVVYDQIQSLSDAEKLRARQNTDSVGVDDLGDISEDLLTYYNGL